MKRFLSFFAVALCLFVAVGSAKASTVVVNFDDLVGQAAVPDGYGGINWGGVWTYYGYAQDPYNPESPPNRIYSPQTGAGEYDFSFLTPEVFDGAYFAGQDFATVYFNLYDGASLVWTSASLNPSGVPTWLDSGYSGLVTKVGIYSLANDFYVADNITYQSSTPEPATLLLMGTGLLGLARRLKRK
ncbi:MAG: PEP-CTERM sorting domain-containing protein [Terriglobia bacterium]|jgi:hypothetical protein